MIQKPYAAATVTILAVLLAYFVIVPAITPLNILESSKLAGTSSPNYTIRPNDATTASMGVGTATVNIPCTTATGNSSGCAASAISGSEVSIDGLLYFGAASPPCPSGQHCPLAYMQVFYLKTENGLSYRLIPSKATPTRFNNGTQVTVTGILVSPSAWSASNWSPSYFFVADLYILSISAS